MSTTQQNYHTQMPNQLMEILMSRAVNASMKSVLTLIARKTYGFHKETDEISLSQFEKHTGLTRPTIVAALSKLQQVQLVLLISKGKSKVSSNKWQLDLLNWEEKLVKLHKLVKNDHLQLVKPSLHTKEKQKIFNNYLPTSSSFKETNFGGETQPLPEPQPLTKDNPEVIFRSLINRAIPKAVHAIRLGENPEDFSEDTGLCAAGIRYYLRKYTVVLGAHHVPYKMEQVVDCVKGFLWGLRIIEINDFPLSKSEVMTRAIDRWFNTTETDRNNLQLNHFVGNYSNIFFNSIKGIGAELGISWRDDLC